jgi:hypothetical protein
VSITNIRRLKKGQPPPKMHSLVEKEKEKKKEKRLKNDRKRRRTKRNR